MQHASDISNLWSTRALSALALVGLGLACWLWKLPETTLTFALLVMGFLAWRESTRGLRWILPLTGVYLLGMHQWLYADSSWLSFDISALAGLISLGVATFALERSRTLEKRLDRALITLELASTELARAPSSQEITRLSVGALEQLELAPHLAFMRWEEGGYCVLHGVGIFAALEGTHLPNPGLSEYSSLKDSWNAHHFVEGLEQADIWQVAAVPVTQEEYKPLGTLILARGLGRTFKPFERSLIQAVARLSGARIGQQRALEELRHAYENTLLTLGLALELRDFETQGHTRRVTELSTALVTHLGLPQTQLARMRQGAYLHDIGKLVVPDGVLHKPGKLEPFERLIIEKHVEDGHRMLSELPFLEKAVLDVVRHHHEKWDGSGYPDRLAGENIPLLARVFALVDVYDALTSERPYKSAWTPSAALEELEKGAGKHFDPNLVGAFRDLLERRGEVAHPSN